MVKGIESHLYQTNVLFKGISTFSAFTYVSAYRLLIYIYHLLKGPHSYIIFASYFHMSYINEHIHTPFPHLIYTCNT